MFLYVYKRALLKAKWHKESKDREWRERERKRVDSEWFTTKTMHRRIYCFYRITMETFKWNSFTWFVCFLCLWPGLCSIPQPSQSKRKLLPLMCSVCVLHWLSATLKLHFSDTERNERRILKTLNCLQLTLFMHIFLLVWLVFAFFHFSMETTSLGCDSRYFSRAYRNEQTTLESMEIVEDYERKMHRQNKDAQAKRAVAFYTDTVTRFVWHSISVRLERTRKKNEEKIHNKFTMFDAPGSDSSVCVSVQSQKNVSWHCYWMKSAIFLLLDLEKCDDLSFGIVLDSRLMQINCWEFDIYFFLGSTLRFRKIISYIQWSSRAYPPFFLLHSLSYFLTKFVPSKCRNSSNHVH